MVLFVIVSRIFVVQLPAAAFVAMRWVFFLFFWV